VLGILLLILVLLQARLWTGAGSLAEINRLDQQIALQNQENADLALRNQTLEDEVSDLKNGLDSIEERARSELGLIRKGETFYLLVEDAPVHAQEPVSPAIPLEESVPDLLQLGDAEFSRAFPPQTDAADTEPPAIEAPEINPYLELFREEDTDLIQDQAVGR
jgi:cell division protein FtsB